MVDELSPAQDLPDEALFAGKRQIHGRYVGDDSRRQKATYPRLVGLERSKDLARQFIQDAKDSVADFGERALALTALADLVITRVS